jgi:hypothetical protein
VVEVSLILPTRGRPELARRALDSMVKTADRPDQLEAVLYIDRDDEGSHGIACPGLKVVKLIRPRARMGAMTQACFAASEGRLIMLLNDDVVSRVSGWDAAVRAAFASHADEVGLVWGNDLFRKEQFPTHPIVSRTVCEIMGSICPAAYHRDYIDTHVYDVFASLRSLGHDRLIYLPNVVFEHMHVEVGKAKFDETCVKYHKTDDEVTYLAWAEERQRAAARLAQHVEAGVVGKVRFLQGERELISAAR